MDQETVSATETAANAEEGSRDLQGSGSDDSRSLTLPKTQGNSLEQALAVEEAFQKGENQRKAERLNDLDPIEEELGGEPEAPNPPKAEEKKEVTQTEEGKEEEEVLEAKGKRDFKKGYKNVKDDRWNRILDKAAKHDQLLEKLAESALKAKEELGGKEERAEKPTKTVSPLDEAQSRIDAAREKLKKAKEALNADEELAAQEELIDAKSDLKLAKAREEDAKAKREEAKANEGKSWETKFETAEKDLKAKRDELWDEDVERMQELDDPDLDLDDPDSPLFKEVTQTVAKWKAQKDPITLTPKVFRKALEYVMDLKGLDLPPLKAKAPPAKAAEVPSVKSNATVHRKNAAVITSSSPGGKPPVTAEQLIGEINKIPSLKRMEVIAEITEQMAARKRR